MATIDTIIVLIFVLAAVIGFRKGIINQLGSLAAIVISIIVCRLFGGVIVDILLSAHPEWNEAAMKRFAVSIFANCIIYIVVYYGVLLAARLLRKVTHTMLLGPVDRIAGSVFSLAKYFLLLSLVLNLYIAFVPKTTILTKSKLGGGQIADLVVGFAPWVLDTISPVETDSQPTPEAAPVKNGRYSSPESLPQ